LLGKRYELGDGLRGEFSRDTWGLRLQVRHRARQTQSKRTIGNKHVACHGTLRIRREQRKPTPKQGMRGIGNFYLT